jgi:hypothetical protein
MRAECAGLLPGVPFALFFPYLLVDVAGGARAAEDVFLRRARQAAPQDSV